MKTSSPSVPVVVILCCLQVWQAASAPISSVSNSTAPGVAAAAGTPPDVPDHHVANITRMSSTVAKGKDGKIVSIQTASMKATSTLRQPSPASAEDKSAPEAAKRAAPITNPSPPVAKNSPSLGGAGESLDDVVAAPYDVSEPRYDEVDEFLADPRFSAQDNNYEDDSQDEETLDKLFEPEPQMTAQVLPANVDLSPPAMAEYLLATGDFNGLQQAIEDLVSAGVMSVTEATTYRDAVALEYVSLLQQRPAILPPRQQRDMWGVQDRDSLPLYEAEDEAESRAAVPFDVEYDSLPVGLESELETQRLYPDLEDVVVRPESSVDVEYLEQLLEQQQRQRELEERLLLQNELDQLTESQRESDENSAQSAADEGEQSLEAELESLPAETPESQAAQSSAEEEELETVGKTAAESQNSQTQAERRK